MKLIAHRGNINGSNPEKENHPDYINEAIKLGHNVEIDVWFINNKFYLGHDDPSKKYIWTYPNKKLFTNSICVLPELGFDGDLSICYGICTDYVIKYQNI
jgi:hypothetical protein